MPDIQNPFSAGFTRRHAIVTAAGLFTLIALITFLRGVPSSTSISRSSSRYPAGWQDRDPPPLGELDSFADNLHLTQSQCQVLFPRLYQEADRAAEWTLSRGGVTLKDLDAAEEKGSARLLIWRNKLYVRRWRGGINTRAQASLAAIHDMVISSTEPLPDVEFVIQSGDNGDGDEPVFALSRKPEQESLWLMPDFGFYSWPEPLGSDASAYTEIRQAALDREWGLAGKAGEDSLRSVNVTGNQPPSWGAKIPKLLWRGVPMVDVRQQLLRASRDQPWSDVGEIDWGKVKETGFLSPAEHCDYRFLAQVEGWGYSGRLKYLQMCRSVIVSHPLRYIQHFHHLFNTNDRSPQQNMVEVPTPLEENLPAVMQALIADDERAERIASNSWSYLRQRYLTPAANNCYFRYAIRAYASVQAFQPERGDRGVAYESWLLTGRTEWEQH
ncbi:glycosyl transferase family 90-domain-containing protein [Filobasidium floriforme]|uniref:glycosyl transferase family 90-domain-containing protein n=1 Tax=Filobasidium floriforme TaxID=5210 RepID=UPI001E8DDD67|nr:glycosyl transferase family 90-domain-containing protein [Filobasidium floriforme]KAH8088263.1 glycosyl transferase family 90-domain-containing protein [Filobasidium floriforme]